MATATSESVSNLGSTGQPTSPGSGVCKDRFGQELKPGDLVIYAAKNKLGVGRIHRLLSPLEYDHHERPRVSIKGVGGSRHATRVARLDALAVAFDAFQDGNTELLS